MCSYRQISLTRCAPVAATTGPPAASRPCTARVGRGAVSEHGPNAGPDRIKVRQVLRAGWIPSRVESTQPTLHAETSSAASRDGFQQTRDVTNRCVTPTIGNNPSLPSRRHSLPRSGGPNHGSSNADAGAVSRPGFQAGSTNGLPLSRHSGLGHGSEGPRFFSAHRPATRRRGRQWAPQ